jgi:hypothetical protein
MSSERIVAAGLCGLVVLAACAAAAPPAPPSAATAPASADAALDPKIDVLMVSACYPCHSDQRNDPWYAKLGPSSWSTTGARGVLNFSRWAQYDPETRAVAVQMIGDAVQKRTMPPVDYTFFNHGARLSDEQQHAIVAWAAQAAAAH